MQFLNDRLDFPFNPIKVVQCRLQHVSDMPDVFAELFHNFSLFCN